MLLKWGGGYVKNMQVKTVERTNWLSKANAWLDSWFMYFVLAIMVGASIWMMILLHRLYQISAFLKNL